MFEVGICDKCGAMKDILFAYTIENDLLNFFPHRGTDVGFYKSCRKEIVENYINELTTEELKKLYEGLPMSASKKLYEGVTDEFNQNIL